MLINSLVGPGSLPLILTAAVLIGAFLGGLIGSHVALYRALWLIVTKCLGCDETEYKRGVEAENARWEAKFDLPPTPSESARLNRTVR